jgi:type IV secretory pathway VirD2 relaxase
MVRRMADDEIRIRLRPSGSRSQDSADRARRLRASILKLRRRAERTARTRTSRSRAFGGPASLRQRSLVKVQFVASHSPGGWQAHGRYLSREGAQREGERGQGFDSQRDDVAIDRRLDGWQKAGDRRLWKVILSPEQGQRLDLRDHTRELVSAMERDLGTRLEWVAIDHYNTTHPHVHLAIRGVDEDGKTLAIPAEYVRHGIRERSQQLATQRLGYRTTLDRARARERGIGAPHFGELDAILEQRADAERVISFGVAVPPHPAAQTLRLQLIGRLKYLEEYGLALPMGGRTWYLHELHRPLLRQMQLLRDVQKSVARGEVLLANPDAPQMLRELSPGELVRGRVAGLTFGEVEERVFLALEGTGGYVYLIPETPEIEQRGREGGLRRGTIVTLERRSAEPAGGVHRIEVHAHGRLDELEAIAEHETVLDLAVLERLEGVAPAEPRETRLRGFAEQWETALALRERALIRAGLVLEPAGQALGRRQAAQGALDQVRTRMRQRDRMPLTFAEVEQELGKPIREAGTTWGMTHRGRLAAYAEDDQGRLYAMLEDRHGIIAVPTQQRDLAIGTEVRARSEPARRSSDDALEQERRRAIVWQLADLERERDRGRGR